MEKDPMDRNEMRGEINRLNYILNEKKKSTDETNFVKDLIKLELKIMAALASLKIIPRNESLNRAFNTEYKVLTEQSRITWENYLQNIPAYEHQLQKILTAEDDFPLDPDYLHNNLNKLLTNASDIRELYDDTINYIKKKAAEPEFNNIYNLTRDLVNHLLVAVKDIVELDEKFMETMNRNNVDYVEKYKLYDVD